MTRSGAHLRQRDGRLAIVQTGGGHQPTYRQVAIHHVDMQLVAAPRLPLALAVFLVPQSQALGKSARFSAKLRSSCRCRRVGSGAIGSGVCSADGTGLGSFLTAFSRAWMAVASRLMCPTSLSPQCCLIIACVDDLRQSILGKDGEGPREGRFAGNLRHGFPAAQTA